MSVKFEKKAAVPGLQGLSGPQVTAVVTLAGGGLKKDAASAAGVHPQCLSRWLTQVHFRKALDSLRAELIEHAASEMRSLTRDALSVLRDTMDESHPALRLKAAVFVLENVLAFPAATSDDESLEVDATEEANRIFRTLGVNP